MSIQTFKKDCHEYGQSFIVHQNHPFIGFHFAGVFHRR